MLWFCFFGVSFCWCGSVFIWYLLGGVSKLCGRRRPFSNGSGWLAFRKPLLFDGFQLTLAEPLLSKGSFPFKTLDLSDFPDFQPFRRLQMLGISNECVSQHLLVYWPSIPPATYRTKIYGGLQGLGAWAAPRWPISAGRYRHDGLEGVEELEIGVAMKVVPKIMVIGYRKTSAATVIIFSKNLHSCGKLCSPAAVSTPSSRVNLLSCLNSCRSLHGFVGLSQLCSHRLR